MASEPRAVASGDQAVAVAGSGQYFINTGNNVSLQVSAHDPALGDLIIRLARSQRPRVTPRPVPLRDVPDPFDDHVDRADEAAAVHAAVAAARVANVVGEDEIGKTYTIRYALGLEAASRRRDGVVLRAVNGADREDVLDALFRARFTSENPVRPTVDEICEHLRDWDALVVLDSVDLDNADAQQFVDDLPRCGLVLTSRDPAVFRGRIVEVEGLRLADSITIVEQTLGRALEPHERAPVQRLWEAEHGHPLRLRHAAWAARKSGFELPSAPDALSDRQGEALALLASHAGASLGGEHLPATPGELEDLTARGLTKGNGPRDQITAAGLARVSAQDATRAAVTALDVLVPWCERATADEQEPELPALIALFRRLHARGHEREAVRLGRAIDRGLLEGRRWGARREVLAGVLVAARAIGDGDSEAWALHQHGTLDVCRGDRAQGITRLREALALRERRGDTRGAALTRHNLRVATMRALPFPGGGLGPLLLLLVLAVVLGGWLLLRDDPPDVTLALVAEGTGTGVVRSADGKQTCHSSCRYQLEQGTTMTLHARADPGSRFSEWEGACSGDGVCKTTLDRARKVVARFNAAPRTRLLVVSVDGHGTVASTPQRIECPGACRGRFKKGSTVRLGATGSDGWVLAAWGGACQGKGECSVPMDKAQTVSARFAQVPETRTLKVVRSGDGVITAENTTLVCGGACTLEVPRGEDVTLVAERGPGTEFSGWGRKDCPGTDPCVVTMNEDTTVTVSFAASPRYTLTLSPTDGGTLAARPVRETYLRGTKVTITHNQNDGWSFKAWTGDCEKAPADACALTMNQDRSAGAEFVRNVTLTVQATDLDDKFRWYVVTGEQTCNDPCALSVAPGTEVTATAIAPKDADDFKSDEIPTVPAGGWSEQSCNGQASCTVTVPDKDSKLVADFNAGTIP